MKQYACNPYLPGWEYVPDGEPHVFGNRIYVFGSHDRAEGTAFCERDYTVWSAPVDDLSAWTNHGIIYRKNQDPHNQRKKNMWAPDVCQGTDGRFYLYYCCAFVPEVGIAVADRPEGPYEFYGYVQDEDGNIWDKDLPFDPGILYEDPEHIWLYIGFGPDPAPTPEDITPESLRALPPFRNASQEVLEDTVAQAKLLRHPSHGSTCLRLAPDMKTVLSANLIAPAHRFAKSTSFAEHPFFEASSMRKIKGKYYFIYSSFAGHELCYATSNYPDRDFTCQGVLISNADLGYQGNTVPRAFYANNHGSLEEINGQWHIFYHRHTNKTPFSRQGCAEPVTISSDGTIAQVEMTTQGLNGKPLPASIPFPAYLICNLTGPHGACLISDPSQPLPEDTPYLTETEAEADQHLLPCLVNMHAGTVCAYKYLAFQKENQIRLTLKGTGTVHLILDHPADDAIASVSVHSSDWTDLTASFAPVEGNHAVYLLVTEAEQPLSFKEMQFFKRD
jgi:hypothetical protein